MSHLIDRLNFFRAANVGTFADGHGVTTAESREWQDAYRKRWQHDKIVRSTHGVNCTGSCSWKIYVKGGIVTWETQQTDYPRTRPDLPDHEPRGCSRGASYSWYLYSGGRLKYPLVRSRLLRLWREARASLAPVAAWRSIVEDPEKKHGRVKLTIAQFFRISGGSNQRRGVVPDIILPTAKYSDEHGERSLPGALPWDEIKPARYARANAPVENYTAARERHQQRMRQHRLFQLLLEELEAEREAENRKVVTLLEERRRAQREQRLAATEEFHNAWRAEQGLPPLPARAAGDAALPEETEETEPRDVLLEETARILQDLIAPAR